MCAWRIQRREINSSYEANERRTVHDSLVSFLFVNFLLENTFFPILCRFTHISFQALCFLYFISSLYRASHIILDYLQYLTPISSVFSYLSAILSSVFSHLSAVLSCVFSYLSPVLSSALDVILEGNLREYRWKKLPWVSFLGFIHPRWVYFKKLENKKQNVRKSREKMFVYKNIDI